MMATASAEMLKVQEAVKAVKHPPKGGFSLEIWMQTPL